MATLIEPFLKGAHMGSCQNYGPFLGTLDIRCRIIIRTQKGSRQPVAFLGYHNPYMIQKVNL